MWTFRDRWRARGGYREFLTLAVPLILSTGSWSVQQFIDRMFLSWYSPEAIAASVPANVLNFAVMCFFIGTATYSGTFVAQYFGAGRMERIGPAVWQGVWVAVLGGLVVLGLVPLAQPIFDLVGHEPAVRELEISYFRVLCMGAIPGISAAALSGFFAGRGRPWPVMWINVLAMLVNVVLNWMLIFGHWGAPELGIVGAGLATVLSATTGFFIFLLLMMTPANNRLYRTISGWRPEGDLFRRLMRYGVPSGAEFFMDLFGFAAFVLLVGRLGTVNLAATNIAFNINSIAFMPMLGSGMAISIMVGQYLGRDRPDLAERSTWTGFSLTLAYMLTLASLYLLVPGVFIAPFAARGDTAMYKEIFALTMVLLRFVAVYTLFDGAAIVFASALKGAGDTRFVMLALGGSSIFILTLPTFLAVAVFGWGLVTCWWFVTLYVVALGVSFMLRFRGGRWKSMRVIERVPGPLPLKKPATPSGGGSV